MSDLSETDVQEVLQEKEGGFVDALHRVFQRADDWYEDHLDRRGRDAVDQCLHLAGWFLIACLGTAAAAWAVAHWREFVSQAPIERIDDTERDMRFMLVGACLGQVVHTGWTTWLAAALSG